MAKEEGSKQGEDSILHLFHQNVKGVLSKDWLLLENQNTVDHMLDPAYLHGIHNETTCQGILHEGMTFINEKHVFHSTLV